MSESGFRRSVTFPVPRRQRLGVRAALLAGFGGLLVLMIIIYVDSQRTLRAFEASNAGIRREWLDRERALEQVRSGLYESENLLSDYVLMQPNPRAGQTIRAELQSIHDRTLSALQSGMQSLPADRGAAFQHLAEQVERHWTTIDSVLGAGMGNRPPPDRSLLRSDVLSQQSEILAILQEISALDAGELQEAERRTVEGIAEFRRRLAVAASLAFAGGVFLAVTTVLYVGGLEKRVQQRYRESLRAQQDLKDLSKRLVDTEERERRSISRELHDEVGQQLGALLFDVERLTQEAADTGPFQRGLQSIRNLAENCVSQVRDMALLLRPSMLDDLGLAPALEWHAREVAKRTGMIVDTVTEGISDDLPDQHKICVYRVVQEALNNCAQHADAKVVRIVVRQKGNHLQVGIEDDGKGFDPGRTRGLGLVGINERVGQLGGKCTVDSGPGRGTRLQVDLPLSNAPADREELAL